MNEKARRAMSLFIILLMAASAVGYAFIFQFYSGTQQSPQQDQQQLAEQALKRIVGNGTVERELQPSEKAFVLQAGFVLLESFAPEECYNVCAAGTDCLPCQNGISALEDFTKTLPGSMVFERIRSENFSARFIGSSGRPQEIEAFDQLALFDTFCGLASFAPRECLLRNIFKPAENGTQPGNQT